MLLLAADAAPAVPAFDVTWPMTSLVVGISLVLGLIIFLRANAFMALIAAAMVVSLMSPGDVGTRISRVADAFGGGCASIGIVIALAAVIGQCMMDSGAADRVVRSFMNVLGEKRSPIALMGSGYVLAIPVFFDTVFYLLVPLARSFYRRTKKHYLKCILAIAAGGAITHTLVPPTPGPLTMAATLQIDLGTMILVGALVALPAAIVGLIFAGFLDRIMPIPMRTLTDDEETEPIPDDKLPGLFVSLLPVLLPVLLIGLNTGTETIAKTIGTAEFKVFDDARTPAEQKAEILAKHDGTASGMALQALPYARVVGNPNFALLLSTIIALWLLFRQKTPTLKELSNIVEVSLMSGGVIILITAAGVAFGQSLKFAKVGEAIESLSSSAQLSKSVGRTESLAFDGNRIVRASGDFVADNYVVDGSVKIESAEDYLNEGEFRIVEVTPKSITVAMNGDKQFISNSEDRVAKVSGKTSSKPLPGMSLLYLGFGVAILLKIAQGSSTAAMIITSSMLAPLVVGNPGSLGFNPVYLATAIGAGSLVGSWMNDSGFWIFAKMGGLTEAEALKSWTVLLVVLGVVAMATTVLLVNVMPMPIAPAG